MIRLFLLSFAERPDRMGTFFELKRVSKLVYAVGCFMFLKL